MGQEPLFFDGWQDAVGACIHGSNRKAVAAEVWPSLSAERAYDRLKAVTNPERRETADLDEVIRIMLVTGKFYPLYYMAQEVSHSRPVPVAPKDEEALLMTTYVQAVKDMGVLTERMAMIQKRRQLERIG